MPTPPAYAILVREARRLEVALPYFYRSLSHWYGILSGRACVAFDVHPWQRTQTVKPGLPPAEKAYYLATGAEERKTAAACIRPKFTTVPKTLRPSETTL